MLGFGAVLVVVCYFAAQAQGGWQSEAEDPEKFEIPLEWLAFGGVSFVLLAALLYAAARDPDPPYS